MSGPIPKPAPRCKHRWSLKLVGGVMAEKVCVNCSRRKPAKLPKSIKRRELPRAQRARICPVSEKQAERLKLYAAARLRVLEKDGGCAACKFPELWIPCDGRGPIEMDHVDGRVGELMFDETNLVSLHRAAHDYKGAHHKAVGPVLRAHARAREATWAAR